MHLTARSHVLVSILVGAVGTLVLGPTLVSAQPVPPATDLSGEWTLTSNCTLVGEEEACIYQGGGNLSQDGNPVNGQVTLSLISGPAGCPAEMVAMLMGSLEGTTFDGTLDGGQLLGILDFNGEVTPGGDLLGGTSSSGDGQPFAGTTCIWSAARQQLFNPEIPTLSGVALGVLALLLLAGGVLVLRRRPSGGPAAS